MRLINSFWVCIWLILWTLTGQSAGAGVSLNLQLVASSNLEVFFLTDLNISGQAPSSVVFTATINSDLPDTECFLVFSMRDPQTLLLRGQSDEFLLHKGTLQLTNLDLTLDYDVGSQAESVENKLMQTGYFPSATYFLKLELYVASDPDVPLASDEVAAIITNPFDIFLVSPVGTPSSPAPLTTTTPLFNWTSTANQFLIKICEKTPENSDPESVMQSRPHYETDAFSPQTSQSFLYPGAGVRPLEPGHTYYWQVTSLVQTSSGSKEYPSAIGAFYIVQQEDPENQQILLSLQRILGMDYQMVMSQLAGFQPKGLIRLDGANISAEELSNTARKFEQGQYHVTSVRAE